MAQAEQAKGWFRLDNAAKLYPAIRTGRWQSMFRLSFDMTEDVDPQTLEKAVHQTLRRFPTFRVRLRKGLFWYYLEENDAPFRVAQEKGHPCLRMKRGENGGYLFRVLYARRRISLEVFHALADGTGGLIFLKALTAQYLRLRGIHVPCTDGVVSPDEPPLPDECEDAYRRIPLDGSYASRREKHAYMMPGTPEMPHTLHMIRADMPVDALHRVASAMGATITEYLTGVMLFTLYQRQQAGKKDRRKPVKVSVPVNMRKFIKTHTVRNFAFFVNVGIDPALGRYTFPEVVTLTHHYMRYFMNPKFLFAGIATNVASERNIFIRICPLFVKNFVLSRVYHAVGETLFTTTLTNVGAVTLPENMGRHVAGIQMLLGPAGIPRSNAAAVSLRNTLTLTFTRTLAEADFERDVLRFLVEQGVPVTVTSNQEA